MKNYLQPGGSITLPAAAVAASSDGVTISSLFGIMTVNVKRGENLVKTNKGVFTRSKPTTEVMAVGNVLYRGNAAGLVTMD